MKFLILGDVHGDWHAMNITMAAAIREHPDITHIVQVGDLAYGWPGLKPFKASKGFFDDDMMDIYKSAEKMWIDGNHENFTMLEQDGGAWLKDWTYMPRGSTLDIWDGVYRVMFFGGASSIDKDQRTPGYTWWPQEYITYYQITQALQNDGPFDAIFTHEHPLSFPYSDKRYRTPFGDDQKELLDRLYKKFKPPFWFFGHHHAGEINKTEDTEWCCCPIIEAFQYTIWDGHRMEIYRKPDGRTRSG